MEYLLKASAVISIFYFCYKIFLQSDTFFDLNRWFLLLGLVTAFTIPFLVIPVYIEYTPVTIPNFNIAEINPTINAPETFNLLDYMFIIYALGAIFFVIRFTIQLTSLLSIIRKNKSFKTETYNFIEIKDKISPFSFFNYIVYNPTDYNSTEIKQILVHEKVHANQLHSLDILITQFACIVLWFNPIIWFYNKSLKQNLEFIADYNTQNKFNSKSYQTTLLKITLPSHQMALSNNFYNSLIKKRIVMLHKSKSKKINLFKYTLIIPLLITFIFNCNTQVIAQSKDESVNLTAKSDSGLIIKLKDNDYPIILIDGKESDKSELNSLKPTNIASINILKGEAATQFYGNKGINGVMQITTKQQGQSSWTVSSKRNEQVIYATTDTIYVNDKPNVLQKLVNEYDKDPLYILDGKEINKKELELIDEQTINSLSRITGEQAINKYGENAKNGVVVIQSKKGGSTNNPYVKIVKAKLYIVDGKEIEEKDFKNIDPENIKSINVLKKESATEKYGKKGKNGAIEIITKE
jgi:beta-lactamase regulating signal transducer with metallopeptidase domain